MLSALNQIFKFRYLILFICLQFLTSNNIAQTEGYYNCVPDEEIGTLSIQAIEKGGRYIPSKDTFHVLVVFVQFPDDNFDINNPVWPKGQPPTYLNTFVDSSASVNSQNGNMSHYFRVMSRDSFYLTGKGVHVIAPHTRYWYDINYGNQLYPYGYINRDVLLKVDSMISFAPFDNWIRGNNYVHSTGQDTIVDMIFMLYRNVGLDSTDYLPLVFPGTAWLGLNQDLAVDNGARVIDMGSFPGSGTTSVMNAANDGGTLNIPNYRVQIHELSHFFFGGNSWHNGGGFWSLFGGSRLNSVRQSCANSLERELLGWIKPDSIYQNTYHKVLTDFATTGASVKIKVPGSNQNEYFRLEYHNRASQFDTPEMHDPNAKGLYILHQTGLGSPEDGWMRLLPADGKWSWVADEVQYPNYYPTGLAVYEKSGIDRINGIDDSRAVSFTWVGPPPTPSVPNPSWIHFYRDRVTNQLIEKTVFRGDGKDAWGVTKNNLFSPWSNPRSQDNAKQQTWISVEISYEHGSGSYIRFHVRFDSTSAQALRPSKPQDLRIGPNPGTSKVRLDWAANAEHDISLYEVSRKVSTEGGGGSWSVIATTTNLYYVDNQYYYNQGSPFNADYRIRTKDTQNKYSIYSDIVSCHPFPAKQLAEYEDIIPTEYSLAQNYPNPFNPLTKIRFSIKEPGLVSLKVFDILGREVIILVNEPKSAGIFETEFDASNLPSGIYIYSLRVNDFVQNNKMLLLK